MGSFFLFFFSRARLAIVPASRAKGREAGCVRGIALHSSISAAGAGVASSQPASQPKIKYCE